MFPSICVYTFCKAIQFSYVHEMFFLSFEQIQQIHKCFLHLTIQHNTSWVHPINYCKVVPIYSNFYYYYSFDVIRTNQSPSRGWEAISVLFMYIVEEDVSLLSHWPLACSVWHEEQHEGSPKWSTPVAALSVVGDCTSSCDRQLHSQCSNRPHPL